jgi:hypothetical protein
MWDSDRPLGLLPDWVIAQLGIETTTRQVLLSAERERHAVNQRKRSSQRDADFVALRHSEALKNIRHVERHGNKPYRWRLICGVPSENKGLALGLKFEPGAQARTGRDEFWIQTVIALGTLTEDA